MGVPKFFRYISERYPCLSELAREQCIPDFDNLYLDMNGIIHNCSHPDDGNVHFSISEKDMFKDIFNYIDKLFFLIKPQRLFFMAVDGVAPRAKMNQQRSRRFRAAKDAETLSLQAKNRGEVIENTPFDSNCITPGTEFMERLHNALRVFIKNKISTDSLWQKCRVILSGHNSPGEGEHKIMDYIRYLKSQKDFDPHTRHCLYGLDADLIILGLCTHELHFVVLREEVKFGKKSKRASIEETRFYLLHLGLFREYLELEFSTLKQYESFSMSKLIDDWVLMGFLVGNDFIPHLPCLHISSNALPLVYQTYMKIYPKLQGNINENGTINLKRLEIFLEALSDVEFQIFQENYADLKYFDAKQSKNGIDEAFDFDVNEILEENHDKDLAQLIESSRKFCEGDEVNDITSDDEEEHIFEEFRVYKRNYYIKKLNFEEMTPQVLVDQSRIYVTALQWVLNYYYKGVQSWGWYYPYHYAPFISDLKNFKDFKIDFDMGKPFLPFEQLLAVLPAASRTLLPVAYQDLFISPDSEIIHFYPSNFETDLNGKKNEWEAVVLIPFIDERMLLHAMKKCETDLKPNEIKRNVHGPMIQYDYTSQSQGECQSAYTAKAAYHVFCTEKPLWRDQIFISNKTSPLIELESNNQSIFYPGFPTMKHLKFKFELRNARVRVFDYPARNESMILIPEETNNNDEIENVAKKCLDQVVYIGWPHLTKAKVTSVSNAKLSISVEGIKENNSRMFEIQLKTVREHLSSRMGIEIGECKVLVHAKTLIGTSLSCGSQGKVVSHDIWSQTEINYPADIVVTEINVHNLCPTSHKKVENLFPVDSRIFFVGNPYYGSEGTVLDPMLVYECGRLKVSMTVLPEPDFSASRTLQSYLESDYLNAYQIPSMLGINTKCLLRLTGQMILIMGEKRPNLSDNVKKVTIGLHMRFPKQNEELAGYTRKKDNSWFFSQKAIALIESYFKKFPMVINYLTQTSTSSNYEFCYESDLFPDKVGEKCVDEILTWLAEQEFTKAERVPCGTKAVEKEAIKKIIESIEKLKTLPVKTVKLQVKPHLLMKPDVNLPEQYKCNHQTRLFDRVVIARNTYLVPVGSRGTVIGILPISDPNPVRLECVRQTSYFLDVLFDKNIPYGNSIYGIAEGRVMRVPEAAVLLIFNNNSSIQNESIEKTPQANESRAPNTQKPINNNPSTAALVKIPQNTTPKAPSVTATENNSKYLDDSISKINTVIKEDFWMPTPDTKIKHHNISVKENPMIQKSYPNRMEKTSIYELGAAQLPHAIVHNHQRNDLNSGTEALKSMLGLQRNNTIEAANLPQIPFVNASQFPPPPTWRNNDPFTSSNNNGLPPMPILAVDEGNKNVPLHYYGQCLPHFAPQQQLPYVNDNFYSPVSLNQKGAFIPLQVMKTCPNKLSQGPADLVKIEEKLRNCSINASRKNNSRCAKAEAPISTVSAASLLLDAQQKTAMLPKKPPKASKIAARFDNQ